MTKLFGKLSRIYLGGPDQKPKKKSHVGVSGRNPVRRLRVQCGLGWEKKQHRIHSCWSFVLHWLVDHHWCSSEISWRGRVSSCLSHLWGHRYSGVSHDKCCFKWPSEGRQLQRRLHRTDRRSSVALPWLHAGFWLPHCLHVDSVRRIRSASKACCVPWYCCFLPKCVHFLWGFGLQVRTYRGSVAVMDYVCLYVHCTTLPSILYYTICFSGYSHYI